MSYYYDAIFTEVEYRGETYGLTWLESGDQAYKCRAKKLTGDGWINMFSFVVRGKRIDEEDAKDMFIEELETSNWL